jgi:hypothetical protein
MEPGRLNAFGVNLSAFLVKKRELSLHVPHRRAESIGHLRD